MAKTYTEEQLNTFDKATLIQLLLMQQSQLQEIDKKLQLLLEQAAVLKNNRFGKKSLLSQRMQRQRANEQLTSKTFRLFMSIIR